MDLIKGLEDSMDIEALLKVSDDGQSAAETLAIKQLAGTGETHDDQTAARPSSNKRRGGTLTPDKEEQKRIKKQMVDKKSRAKKKAEVEKTKVDLKTSMKNVEDLKRKNTLLNKRIKWTEQQLENADTHIGELTSLIEGLNQTDNSKQQDSVRKLEKELLRLKIKYQKFQCQNASLKAEQQQFEDFCNNELNQIQELPVEQESGPEENGRLGFMGDERRITTTGEMREFKSMLMTIITQNTQIFQRMDALKTSTSMAIEQISQRINALETRNPPSQG